MPSLGYATISVLANTKPFEASLKKSVTRVAAATAAVAGGFALGKAIGAAVGNAVQLERELARVNTIVDNIDMEKFFSTDQIRAFSNEAGIATDALTEGLYRALSSGTEAADALGLVGQAVKLQLTQPGTELVTVVDALTSALNAYGTEAYDAASASDILFKAAQFGKGTFQDFSHYISTAIPIAEDLGVSFEELAAVGAASTRTGKTARVVFTGLKVAMQELSDSSKNAGKIFKEEFGETFQQYVGRTGDLTGAFAKLSRVVGTKNLTNVFGAKEGAQAVKLLASQAGVLPQILQETANSAGVVDTEVKKIEASVSRQFDRIKIRVTNAMGGLGDAILPTLARALGGVADLFDQISAKGPEIQAALAPVGEVIAQAWAQVLPTFQAVGQALSSINWAQLGAVVTAAVTGILMVVGPLFIAANQLAQILISYVAPAFNAIVGVLNQMKPIIVVVTAAIVAYNVALFLNKVAIFASIAAIQLWNAVTKISAAVTAIQAGALNRLNIAMTIAAVKAKIMSVAMAGTLGPIGLIITGLAALAAGFVYAWKHSEKFRVFVVGALKGVLSYVQVWVYSFLKLLDGIVSGAAKAFGWVPGLGGKLKAANEAFDNFAAGVNQSLANIKDKVVNINVHTSETRDLDGRPVGPDGRPYQGPGYTNADKQFTKDAVERAKSSIDFNMPAIDFGGGGGTKNFSDDAAKKAKEAASKIKAAMARIKTDLNRIAKNTSKQTVDAIKNNFEQLYADMKDAKVTKAVIANAKKMEAQLLKLAKKRDTLSVVYKNERLSLEQMRDALKDLKDEAKSFTDGIKQQVNELGNVAQQTQGYAQTFTGIRNQLRYAVASTQAFVQNINRLRELGLNETNLRQLIEAGPAAAGDAARILAASGAAGINTINGLQGQLDAAGASLANSAYDQFYKQGIAVAQGLVNGLQSQEAALLAQMDKLGDRIAERFKKKLGIKSPSRVFAGLGEMIPEGLAKGIDTGIPVARRSVQNMSTQVIHMGGVQVNGVQDPRAAQRAGILAGAGIKGVLAQKKTDQALDGIG